jgi:hypothetical protein
MSNTRSELSNEDAVAVITAVEGEIRDFVRRDAVMMRRAGEIDHLIAELQALRTHLLAEGERLQRELTKYAQATQAALSSVKIITESIGQWKSGAARRERG